MKPRSIINKVSAMISMIPANVTGVMAAVVNEFKAMVDGPVMGPRRVKVPVRVWHSEFSDRRNY